MPRRFQFSLGDLQKVVLFASISVGLLLIAFKWRGDPSILLVLLIAALGSAGAAVGSLVQRPCSCAIAGATVAAIIYVATLIFQIMRAGIFGL